MTQPGNGMTPPPMAPTQPHPQQQQRYQQPPPQQRGTMPPPQQPDLQPPPPHTWTEQQRHHYHQLFQQFCSFPLSSFNETRSLWIGNLQNWMDELYLLDCFHTTGELVKVKTIHNKQTGQQLGYGFMEFKSRTAAEDVLKIYYRVQMPFRDQYFRLNWATLGERHKDETPDYTIFVGNLAPEVSDYVLQEDFKSIYPSVKGAKVVTDKTTGCSKGYGFVRFGDEREQVWAMREMNGIYCASKPMCIGSGMQKELGEQHPARFPKEVRERVIRTIPPWIYVGELDPSVSDEALRG